MSRHSGPEGPDLIYDGTAYCIASDAIADLLARGVIVVAGPRGPHYELSLEHTIDELDDVAEVVARSDAPRQSRLRVILRNAGFSTGRTGFAPRKDYISIDDGPDD
jgi:hypothetical protein